MQCACVCLCPTREKQRDIELNQRQRKDKVGDLVRENRVERRYFKSLSLFPFSLIPATLLLVTGRPSEVVLLSSVIKLKLENFKIQIKIQG